MGGNRARVVRQHLLPVATLTHHLSRATLALLVVDGIGPEVTLGLGICSTLFPQRLPAI
jgi:hypothetical protein